MFKFEPVGRYLVNICGTMSCALLGADELMHHAEQRLGIKAGGTTPDGLITLEHAECQAACTEAPCLQVNYRYRYRVTTDQLDRLLDDLAAGAPGRRDPAARHAWPRCASTSRPTGASGPAEPEDVHDAAGRGSPSPSRRRPDADHRHARLSARAGLRRRRPARDRHVALPVRGLLHARPLPGHRAATRACKRRARPSTPQAVHDEVKTPPCSAAAAPASPPA